MKKTYYRGVGLLGIIIGAASMVVIYASGMVHPGSTLPQTATVNLQDRRTNRKNGNTTSASAGVFDYKEFEQVYSVLKEQYYDQEKLSTGAMMEGALKGMIEAIGDPYTTFFDVQQNADFTSELKGQQDFEGIGAAVLKKGDAIEVQEVYKGTPSFEAGVRPLDLVMEINGEKTTNMTTEIAVSKIRGPENTDVTLTILRPSDRKVLTLKITRKKVSIPSVSSKIITAGGKKIGYINISIIGQETENAMKAAVKELTGVDAMILDLRGNGGGFLDIGVEIASHFVAKGKTVVTTRYRDTGSNEIYKSAGYDELEKVPTVILVDSLTASAGEIIAAALRDTNGSMLIGTKTYGKGSIQTIQEFGTGSALKYTIGKWYTPNGENVTGTGMLPDIDVPFDFTGYQTKKIDNQLEKAQTEVLKLIK